MDIKIRRENNYTGLHILKRIKRNEEKEKSEENLDPGNCITKKQIE